MGLACRGLGFVIYLFIFSDFSSNFFWGFFFCLKVEHINFFINTSVLYVWFAEFCVWFAFVLGFDLSASDDVS